MTGNTSCVTKAWIEAAFPQDHVLIAGYEKAQDPHLKAIALDNKRLLSQLTDTYEFDCIVYFSQYLIPHNEEAGELERLRHVLQINRERPVRILYLAGPESIVTPETGKTIIRTANEIKFNQIGEVLQPYQLSAGEKQMLAILLTVLVEDNQSYVLFMDEPEISLHFEWQKQLISLVLKLNPNIQIIMTTHSPAVVMDGWTDRVTEVNDITIK